MHVTDFFLNRQYVIKWIHNPMCGRTVFRQNEVNFQGASMNDRNIEKYGTYVTKFCQQILWMRGVRGWQIDYDD